MWVRFQAVHWHRFSPQLKTRFLPGGEHNLPTAVAEKAIADGHAIKMKKARKGAKPEPVDGEEG